MTHLPKTHHVHNSKATGVHFLVIKSFSRLKHSYLFWLRVYGFTFVLEIFLLCPINNSLSLSELVSVASSDLDFTLEHMVEWFWWISSSRSLTNIRHVKVRNKYCLPISFEIWPWWMLLDLCPRPKVRPSFQVDDGSQATMQPCNHANVERNGGKKWFTCANA